MNYKMVFYILGRILLVEAVLMALPALCGLIYGESSILWFGVTMVILAAIGIPLSMKKPKNTVIYAKEGFVVVGLAWITMSLFGALPFTLSGAIPNYIDALFETISGFTTTGSTILTEIEHIDRGILFWRSFTHWIGGMGVLVFVLAILPMSNEHSMHLMRAEVPGHTVGKLVPKIRSTAKILYGIYIALSVLEIILLLLGGLSLYDAVTHTFATAGTGGFSVKNASVGFYNSAYVDGVISVFMLLFGIDFTLFYLLLLGNIRTVLKSGELKLYLGIVAAATIVITLNILPMYDGILNAFRYAFFQVSSVITTTGFITADFSKWPQFSQMILILLMFVGACAGSTGGGMKVSRVMIMFKGLAREIRRLLHPRAVEVIRINGNTLPSATVRGVNTFLLTYVALMLISALLISVDGFDFTTNVTAAITTLGNVGPGLGVVYPAGNFSEFSWFSKIVLSFNMLLGRLEIFPLIVLFSPRTWRK
ncbi:MAG: TrkH family potassium uptake protein [Clostridia bacterium]|nr:TrkH family potassium uptake protein [Clostridia bacterium]